METVRKNDFVELKFTGSTQGEVFDSNISDDLKKISTAKPKKVVVVVGQGMVVPGLDSALEGKEVGTEYAITLPAKEGFGERRRELLKTIPLRTFTERKINPQAGMMFTLDNALVKIIAVSSARVTTDFNNPLAGKELCYRFTIVRKVHDDSEKATALFELMFRFVPEFEVKESVIAKGPKELEIFVNAFKEKFKELHGKALTFELKETKPAGKDAHSHEHEGHGHSQGHEHAPGNGHAHVHTH